MRFRMFHELKLMVLGLFSGLRALGNGIIYICLSHSLFFVSSLSLSMSIDVSFFLAIFCYSTDLIFSLSIVLLHSEHSIASKGSHD